MTYLEGGQDFIEAVKRFNLQEHRLFEHRNMAIFGEITRTWRGARQRSC